MVGDTFPLQPLDVDGRSLAVGDAVRVLSVESCAKGLPQEDGERLATIVGKTRLIVEFDHSGFVWLSFGTGHELSADFCLFPKELALV